MTVIGNRELYQKSALVSKSNPWDATDLLYSNNKGNTDVEQILV